LLGTEEEETLHEISSVHRSVALMHSVMFDLRSFVPRKKVISEEREVRSEENKSYL
jgi:hypothetical protein